MISLSKAFAQSDVDFITLHWEISIDSIIPDGTTFSIYRSQSPGLPETIDEYDLVANNVLPLDGQYIDNSVKGLADFTRVWYYKITDNEGTIVSGVQPIYVKNISNDKYVNEILRRKQLALKFSARDFHLLKKRSWGKHCSKSWDDTLMRDTDPNCPVCYGTGWEGGYFKPITFRGMANPSPKYSQIMMFGEWKPSDVMLYTLSYPLLSPRDVVVDDEGRRWVVVQIRYLEKAGYKIEQQAQLALISPDDKIYKVPI